MKKLETPEDDLLRVETCSVTQINMKAVALTVKFVLLVVYMKCAPVPSVASVGMKP
jgi:hypothetical protein